MKQNKESMNSNAHRAVKLIQSEKKEEKETEGEEMDKQKENGAKIA